MPPLLALSHVTKKFPGVVALQDVTLDIADGETHAIVGENGAGKSTLIKILSGVIGDYTGQLLHRGSPVKFAGTRDAEHAGIGIIHQELNLVEELSAVANIFLGRELTSRFGLLDEASMQEHATALLADLECQFDPLRPVGELRVGDQQLVEIAKALASRAQLLIMDEPTSALTESESARLFRVIERFRAGGGTVIYISHKMDEVFRLADRVTVLRDGELVRTLARRDTSPREVTHLMVGRDLGSAVPHAGHAAGEVLLEVERLSLPWPGHARRWRLQDISFTLRRGEVLGIAGLMGAGRTELLECLFGASTERAQGTLRLEGRPVSFAHPADAVRAGIALVTEDRKRLGLFEDLNVRENTSLCDLEELSRAGFVDRSREVDVVAGAVTQLGIKTAGLEAGITGLSGGNQQKCILGRWLLTRPKVLLLDDPTRGVDIGAKAELYRLIDSLRASGLGVIVTSSELPELLTLSDRILVLREGRLTGEFSRSEATERKIMEVCL